MTHTFFFTTLPSYLFVSPKRKLLYATDIWSNTSQPTGTFQHLTCFLAGLFALGAATIPDVDPRHAWAAEGLAHTCWITYADSATGLGPETVQFQGESRGRKWVEVLKEWESEGSVGTPPGVNQATPIRDGESTEYALHDTRYLLRPEEVAWN